MKKILSAVAAVGLAVAMTVSSFAYVASPEKSSESQIKLVSIKAVDVQTAITGVRSYSELTDTTRGYQVNDVIYLATTVEVRNLEKSEYRTLKSIEGKDVPTIVGSPYVDLSYSKYASPILLSHIYSGINDATIGTFADVISVSKVLDYDKDKNEVKFKFRGYEQNAVTWLTGFSTTSYNNVYLSAYIQNDKIYVPALRAKDGKNTITLGNQTYNYSYDAPSSMAYTLVLTGVAKDNAGAASGDFYAKIQISGAEKFVDEGYYYIAKDGKRITSAQLATGGTYADYKEWVDYIKVNVKLLEIENAYNVYKYEIPSSAMLGTKIPVIYFGDDEDYDQLVVGKADPTQWDYSTGKTTKDGSTVMIGTTDIDTAGGVTSIDAVYTYTYNASTRAFASTSKKSVPLTSVVYTELATVYAPAYYAGIVGGTADTQVKTVYGDTFTTASKSVTKTRTTVDDYTTQVTFSGPLSAISTQANLDVTVIDAYSGNLIRKGTGSGAAYTVSLESGVADPQPGYPNAMTYTLKVTPTSGTVYLPGTAQDSSSAQAWEVYLGTPVYIPGNTQTAASTAVATQYATAYDLVNWSSSAVSTFSWPTGTWAATGTSSIYIAGDNVALDLPNVVGVLNTNDNLGANAALQGSAVMLTPHISGDWLDLSTATQLVPKATPKNVAASDTGIRITLKNEWDDSVGKEKAAGSAFNASGNGYNVKNVYVYWTTSNEMGIASNTGIPVASFSVADGTVEIDGSDIIVYPGINKTSNWVATDVTGSHLASPSTLSAAYVKADATNGSAVASAFTGYYGSNGGVATGASIISGGWAQMNGRWVSTSATPSYGYANARVEVEFNVPASTYSYNQTAGTLLYGNVAVVEGDTANGYYGTGHNGIDVYVITYNSDDQPLVAIATESTYFESESGLSIAMFDAHNIGQLGTRISRSSNTNLVYGTGGGNVANSSKIITAMKYFGLDTSWSTTYRIVEDTFESKGAQAVYSEEVKGTFNYGTLTLVGEAVDEGTDDVEVPDDIDDGETDDIDDGGEEVDDVPAAIPPKTGDSSVNIAIALAAAAIVAAAGLVFVMKKAR